MSRIQLARMKCCGIAEINGLSQCDGPLAALKDMHAILNYGITWPPLINHGGAKKGVLFPFLTFTGAFKSDTPPENNYAQKFADYIVANNLGTVVTLPIPRQNWTGNLIQIWVWEPNYPNLWALLGPAPPFVPEPLPGVENVPNQAAAGIAPTVGDRLTPREAEEPGSPDRGGVGGGVEVLATRNKPTRTRRKRVQGPSDGDQESPSGASGG